MTEKKQIAKIIADNFMDGYYSDEDFEKAAEKLQEAGFHRQRKAEWVTTTEERGGKIVNYIHRCTDCGYFYKTVCPRGEDYCHKCGAKISRKEQT